jgi:hypothetical protein
MPASVGGERGADEGESVSRQRTRHDEDPVVGLVMRIALEREANEIVAVAGHQAAGIAGRPIELFGVRYPERPKIVRADRIATAAARARAGDGALVSVVAMIRRRCRSR